MKLQFITSSEYINRLVKLGWLIKYNGSHIMAFAPDKIGTITWSKNNWNKNWRLIARDLFRFAKCKNHCGYPDLNFVFNNPFVIPKSFDYVSQTIKKEDSEVLKILSSDLIKENYDITRNREFSLDGKFWDQISNIYLNNYQINIVFTSGKKFNLKLNNQILMRRKI